MSKPAWLVRGIREHAARFPSPPPLEASMTVIIEPPETLAVRVRADHLRAIRKLFHGQSDDEIVGTMFAQLLEKFGVKP